MKKYFMLTLAVILIIASCKKNTPAPTRTDMLRTGKWYIASGTIRLRLPNGNDTTLNYLNFLPLCRRDDYVAFYNNANATIFTGADKCTPADPDTTSFTWSLTSNDNLISLYHGFDFIYTVTESIQPYVMDTISQSPILVLDTIHGILDTDAGYTRVVPILDTIWNLQFDSTNVANNDLYNAKIVAFSQSSFTINFSIYGQYPDSTGHGTGMFNDLVTPGVTYDWNPVIRKDTFFYSITYQNR